MITRLDRRGKTWLVLCATALILFLPGRGIAADGLNLYLTPAVGGAWFNFRSIEIEKSFLGEGEAEDSQQEGAARPVGNRGSFSGSGVEVGGSAGIQIFSLALGVHYDWNSIKTDGFIRRYTYSETSRKTTGEDFPDAGRVSAHRVLFELGYGLPVGRFEFLFRTRIGAILVEDGGYMIGRSADTGTGISADLGLSISVFATRFMAIGLDGWYGVFSFFGAYDGVLATGGALSGNLSFRI